MKFDQAPNVACITTVQVLSEKLPILQVRHYADDDGWAFTCGTTHRTEDCRVVGMGTILKLDPSLRSIADLLPGWSASRDGVGAEWKRYPSPPDADEEAVPGEK